MNVISAEWCMSPGERTSLVLQVTRRAAADARAGSVAQGTPPEARWGVWGSGAGEDSRNRSPCPGPQLTPGPSENWETGKLEFWPLVRFSAFQKPRIPGPRLAGGRMLSMAGEVGTVASL
jgi:hypothetical protein